MEKKQILNALRKGLGFKKDEDFAEFLGIAQNTYSNWKARGTMDYEKIITKCEEVNANWLITGRGSMFVTSNPIEQEQKIDINMQGQSDNLRDESALLREVIGNVQQQMEEMRKDDKKVLDQLLAVRTSLMKAEAERQAIMKQNDVILGRLDTHSESETVSAGKKN